MVGKCINKKYMPVLITGIILFLAAFWMILMEYRDSDGYVFDLSVFDLNKAGIENGCLVADDDTDMEEEAASSRALWLSEGDYEIEVSYRSNDETHLAIFINDNEPFYDIYLDPTAGESATVNDIFKVSAPTDRAKVRIYAPTGSGLVIESMRLYADHRIYTDAILHFILLLISAFLFIHMLFHMSSGSKAEGIRDHVFLALIVIAASIPFYLVKRGGALFCVDTRTHMMRIEGIAEGLRDGQFPVIIAPNLHNEHGELTFMYPNAFLYPYGIMRLFGVSMTCAYRIMMVVTNIITAVCTYYAGKTLGLKRKGVLLFTLAYVFCPHRLFLVLSLGTAGAQGLAVSFIPLCIAGAYCLLKNEKKGIIMLVTGISGCMHSHVLTFLMVSVCIAILALVNIRTVLADKGAVLKKAGITAGLFLYMNLGFLVIFIRYYLTDWDKDHLGELWDFRDYTLNLSGLMKKPEMWLYAVAFVMLAIMLILSRAKRSEVGYRFSLECAVIALISFILCTRLIPWDFVYEHMPFFRECVQYIQDTHRFGSVIEPMLLTAVALLGPYAVDIQKEGQRSRRYGILAILAALLVFASVFQFVEYFSCDILLYDQVSGDINTIDQPDYVPTGTTGETYASDIGRVSDEEHIESFSYHKTGTHVDYEYTSLTDDGYADIPLLYYVGYEAVDEMENRMEVSKADNGRILVRLKEGGPHEMHLRFRINPLYSILYFIMLLSWTVFYVMLVIYGIRHAKSEEAT